jgi:TRAP-type C4-dicarboxylate transport system substrate-binding protein
MTVTMDKQPFQLQSISPKTSIPIAAAPLYKRIHHEIKHLITSGTILPGELIPPETDLAKKYNVSRFTIQQVFRLLVQEGLVTRQQGRGTFVRELDKTHSSDSITLQLGCLQCAGDLHIAALRWFFRRVAELTRNQVKISFSKETLGPASTQLKKVAAGEQDMFSASTEWIEEIEPKWRVASLPFLFHSMSHAHRFTTSGLAESLRCALVQERNIRVLADNWVRPSRLILALQPCFEVEDFKGLSLRIPNIQTYHYAWQAVGAKPVKMDWNEIPLAIRMKKIQAIDVPRDIAQRDGVHRCARYVTNTKHIYPRTCILISERSFSCLRSDVQKALLLAAKEAGQNYSQGALAQWEEDKRKMMFEGSRFIETDPTPFRQKAGELYDSIPELRDEIKMIAAMQTDRKEN